MRSAAEYADKWMMRRQRKHVDMVESSVIKLQNNILDMLTDLRVKGGSVEGIRTNLKQAQAIHKKVEILFEKEWSATTKEVVDDFKPVSRMIQRQYRYLDEAVQFTSVDRGMMEVLRDGVWRDYLDIGSTQKNRVIQALYDNVIANGEFHTLVSTIEGALMGSSVPGVTGRSLAQYGRLYARDMLMNYQREVNVKKAEDIGMTHFLYIGDIIATTRDFCRRRVGKAYTKKQINSWTGKWAGKSGPAMTHCGGWNCRHHWQGIRKEWMEGKKRLDVADWNLEQRAKG